MKIALLLRGFHFIERDRFGYRLEADTLLPSLLEKVVQPLRQQHTIKVFAVTYPSPILEKVRAVLQPERLVLLESRGSSQVQTFCRGLAEIQSDPDAPFDRVIATRFDLLYLQPATAWEMWTHTGIFFPWREYEHFWKEHHRVGDAIHVVDAPYLPAFESALRSLEGQPDLHHLYRLLEPSVEALHFLTPGFHDSNTLFANPECENPLYRIGYRPRLRFSRPVSSPWLRELKRRLPARVWKPLSQWAARLLQYR